MRFSRAVIILLLLASFFYCGVLFIPDSAQAASWAHWEKRAEPVFVGEYDIAGDPTIIYDKDRYRMFYTCIVDMKAGLLSFFTGEVSFHPALCQATSRDGFSWEFAPTRDNVKGLALRGAVGQWDENIEGSCVVKKGREYFLFYSGYRDKGDPQKGFPASLTVARSTDGVHFQPISTGPVLNPTKGWYDSDAVYSPVVIQDGDHFLMVYAGHCYNDCQKGPAVVLLSATSSDGLQWTKGQTPVLEKSRSIPWMSEGVAEPGLMKGPDGAYYLFFTGLEGEKRTIGVARSMSIAGPWEINPEPVISATPDGIDDCGALAPQVRLEGATVRMWYHALKCPEKPTIGYAESQWPLYHK